MNCLSFKKCLYACKVSFVVGVQLQYAFKKVMSAASLTCGLWFEIYLSLDMHWVCPSFVRRGRA